MAPSFDIVVHGTPAPQGSKVAGRSSKTGRMFVYEQNSDAHMSWRQDVIAAAMELRQSVNWETLDGPVSLAIFFRLARPASVNINRRPFPCVRPDVDKLTRNTMDALTQAAIYRDDAQVVALYVTKRYATDDPDGSPGATIRVALVPLPEII